MTITILQALKATLNCLEAFGACIWAMVSCAFWGMMHFGEVSVSSRSTFDGTKHLKHCDPIMAQDMDGKPYAQLDLPAAKPTQPGKTQSVFC
jgi:hypothetical protein